jgi:RNA polymerase sigma-70 factor, ECF subfamily
LCDTLQPDRQAVVQRAVVNAARDAYGRLRAWLAYQWRDVAAAEDALGVALERALVLWPEQGVPDAPEAWLMTVAKRELLQAARHKRLHDSPEVQAVLEMPEFAEEEPSVPDQRLKLLFVCAHPAIDASVRPALMLQTVLGLEAKTIAQAMLTSESVMAQRLVRAKKKIRDARLRFEEPEPDEFPERLDAVLEAIYAAYGLGWDAMGLTDDSALAQSRGLREEALYLGQLICQLQPDAAEAWGLLALMHFCDARAAARWSHNGCFVPLQKQDVSHWSLEGIRFADQCLHRAAQFGTIGAFQLEAAIQSAHCQRAFSGEIPWSALLLLYQQLNELAPSLGSQVAHAIACAHSGDLVAAQKLLDTVPQTASQNYQPYWVARAHLAHLRGASHEKNSSISRALGLTSSPALRDYLLAEYGQT